MQADTSPHRFCRALAAMNNVSLTGGPESLNGKSLAFLHLGGVTVLHNWHGFSTVDLERLDVVALQIPYTLDWVHLAVELDLITLHHFLHSLTDVCHSDIDTSSLDTGVCGLFHCLQQRIVSFVEGVGPSTVYNVSVNMDTKIDLHNVIVLMLGIIRPRLVTGSLRAVRYNSTGSKPDPISILSGIHKAQRTGQQGSSSFLGESSLSMSGSFKEPDALEFATKLPMESMIAGRSVVVKAGDLSRSFKKFNGMVQNNKIKRMFLDQRFYLKPSKRKLHQKIKTKKIRFDTGVRKLLGVVRNAVRKGY
ncbi:hypothetical protein OGAPHI_000414 [Ogataea philodendri]|uniref:Uncharacterized protein n=1 Tax=Ogataea philodendri TaxID=1378263 RepID=A0A9P8PHY9_9ASCO|nr:uncharacterized protein OGAPHI_000414 [Ogataea philodendri]KAH3671709.1 hypothetical protein OGAPHI_000414 [Ogataea philodendri]